MLMMKLLWRRVICSHKSWQNLFFSSSSISAVQTPPPKSSFISNYLVESCGLSPAKAANSVKYINGVTSREQPDSIRHFLKQVGFSDTEIRKLVARRPRFLSAHVEKDLKPNFQALCSYGFTEGEIRKVAVCNPGVLLSSECVSRIESWKRILNGDTKELLLALSRNRDLINHNFDMNIVPKISLLKDFGFSENDVGMILVRCPGFMSRSISSMEDVLKQTQELGFQLGSAMFARGFGVLSSIGPDNLASKMEFFKTLGWSEQMFRTALLMSPHTFNLSEENMRRKMKFLTGAAGCSESYIASRPMLLNFSLEKRLVPRHNVMKILKAHKLVSKDFDLYGIMTITDKRFLDKFVHPFKDKAPDLIQAYSAASAEKVL